MTKERKTRDAKFNAKREKLCTASGYKADGERHRILAVCEKLGLTQYQWLMQALAASEAKINKGE